MVIKLSPSEFIRQVRKEGAMVAWAGRKEVLLSTFMVLLMVFLSSVFLFVVDQVIAWGVQIILGLGN
ncbi:Preprotein translocase SecE [Candidatus Endolissoclinum faulkneri L5]|uniref:Protein translocase subunit SecE n=1 Tax=Candidatus Endolissoclinum faulkneri L5 TaxID=1401328 RepID=V9TTB4_9PROT|nr:preprotein translocase subunit SecE [Candidatus Endolissoclinum faulkneri]AHC73397.1 Preprotein translocase SecE [Candidatus Endolissoclinum faulkneri L5]